MKINLFLSVLFLNFVGYTQNWRTNFEEAKAEASRDDKHLVLVFSGSDWCAPCMKLDNVVWKSDAFKQESEKNWIIYKADFPKKKANQLAPDLTAANQKLAEKYNRGGSFPLVVLLDKTGKILGMTGFKNVPANDYIQLIHSLEKK
ncbi:thioredoxin family protein [Flavobacterium sp. TSSA_36]|uniref:thioredoxin family protein n=1 Tax=Flavobacterium sp. TSSA_36 TaxID=3447669 RepID=UPI003F356410